MRGETYKKIRALNVVIFHAEEPSTKSHLQALVLGFVQSDISGHEKVAGHPNGTLYFHESQEHAIFLIVESILHNL